MNTLKKDTLLFLTPHVYKVIYRRLEVLWDVVCVCVCLEVHVMDEWMDMYRVNA